MSRRETKAEVTAQRDHLQRANGAQSVALRYLATGARPDWEERVRYAERDGRKVHVRLRAFGLARGDGGIVVAEWRFPGASEQGAFVEAFYQIDATRPDNRAEWIARGVPALADAYAQLYAAHISAVHTAAG